MRATPVRGEPNQALERLTAPPITLWSGDSRPRCLPRAGSSFGFDRVLQRLIPGAPAGRARRCTGVLSAAEAAQIESALLEIVERGRRDLCCQPQNDGRPQLVERLLVERWRRRQRRNRPITQRTGLLDHTACTGGASRLQSCARVLPPWPGGGQPRRRRHAGVHYSGRHNRFVAHFFLAHVALEGPTKRLAHARTKPTRCHPARPIAGTELPGATSTHWRALGFSRAANGARRLVDRDRAAPARCPSRWHLNRLAEDLIIRARRAPVLRVLRRPESTGRHDAAEEDPDPLSSCEARPTAHRRPHGAAATVESLPSGFSGISGRQTRGLRARKTPRPPAVVAGRGRLPGVAHLASKLRHPGYIGTDVAVTWWVAASHSVVAHGSSAHWRS